MSNCENWLQWLNETRFSSMSEQEKENFDKSLVYIRDKVLDFAQIKPSDKVIDIGTGTGLLAFGALEKISDEGCVVFSDVSKECLAFCEEECRHKYSDKNTDFVYASCDKIPFENNTFDKVLMRSVLAHIVDKQSATDEIYRILKQGGEFIAFEPLLSTNVRYHQLTSKDEIDDYEDFKQAEDAIMSDKNNSLTNFDNDTLAQNLKQSGFSNIQLTLQDVVSNFVVAPDVVKKWFESVQSPNHPCMKDNFLKFFDENKVEKYITQVQKALLGKEISTTVKVVWVKAVK